MPNNKKEPQGMGSEPSPIFSEVPPIPLPDDTGHPLWKACELKRNRSTLRSLQEKETRRGEDPCPILGEYGWPNLIHYTDDKRCPESLRGGLCEPNIFNN